MQTLDKSPEDMFHFDINFAEKLLPKWNNSAALGNGQSDSTTEYSTFKYPEKNIQNLIVNKLYNELGTENNNNQSFEMSKPFTCNHSCKCRVEIKSRGDDVVGPTTKCIIKIEDCDCQPSDVLTVESDKVLFAENPGYGAVLPTQNDTNEDKFEQTKLLEKDDEAKSTGTRILKSIDLLNFAKQIASGMVS